MSFRKRLSIPMNHRTWLHPRRSPCRSMAGVLAILSLTWHGFALNVTTDLSYFDLMVPCGIANVTMTSVARELAPPGIEVAALASATRAQVARAFCDVFALEHVTLQPDTLQSIVEEAAQ